MRRIGGGWSALGQKPTLELIGYGRGFAGVIELALGCAKDLRCAPVKIKQVQCRVGSNPAWGAKLYALRFSRTSFASCCAAMTIVSANRSNGARQNYDASRRRIPGTSIGIFPPARAQCQQQSIIGDELVLVLIRDRRHLLNEHFPAGIDAQPMRLLDDLGDGRFAAALVDIENRNAEESLVGSRIRVGEGQPERGHCSASSIDDMTFTTSAFAGFHAPVMCFRRTLALRPEGAFDEIAIERRRHLPGGGIEIDAGLEDGAERLQDDEDDQGVADAERDQDRTEARQRGRAGGQEDREPDKEQRERLQEEQEADQPEASFAGQRLAPFAAQDRRRTADRGDRSQPFGRQHGQHEIGHHGPAELEQTADQGAEESELVPQHTLDRIEDEADGDGHQCPAQDLRQAGHRRRDAGANRGFLSRVAAQRAMDQRHVAEDRDDREHIDRHDRGDIECGLAGIGRADPFPDRAGDRVQRRELR